MPSSRTRLSRNSTSPAPPHLRELHRPQRQQLRPQLGLLDEPEEPRIRVAHQMRPGLVAEGLLHAALGAPSGLLSALEDGHVEAAGHQPVRGRKTGDPCSHHAHPSGHDPPSGAPLEDRPGIANRSPGRRVERTRRGDDRRIGCSGS